MRFTVGVIITAVFMLVSYMPGQQNAQPVSQTQGAPPFGVQGILTYSSSNLTYTCFARSAIRSARTITISAGSAANPVSFTSTHGFDYQSLATTTPIVRISGGTGNWTAVNGVWVATPTASTTFTIAVDSSAFGAVTGTLVGTTYAPSMTAKIWAIEKLVYDASSNLIWFGWGGEAGGVGSTNLSAGASSDNLACASRSTYGYQ